MLARLPISSSARGQDALFITTHRSLPTHLLPRFGTGRTEGAAGTGSAGEAGSGRRRGRGEEGEGRLRAEEQREDGPHGARET